LEAYRRPRCYLVGTDDPGNDDDDDAARPDAPQLSVEVWPLTKGARPAQCDVAPHPLGLELRCYVDGELRRSRVFRDGDALKLEAFAWQEPFSATGWRRE
jgi:hypothetical protein